jgi:hypothetical protein
VPAPIVILGSQPVRLAEEALVERENATIADLEMLLAAKPRAAVITSGGENGFFRASLCLERGISRVVLRRGVFDETWERELAARAARFGADVYVHDDARGYARVKPRARLSIGAPDMRAWVDEANTFFSDDVLREASPNAHPLAQDPEIDGLPTNLEEIAFVQGDKPVLYLVIPQSALEALRNKYPGVTIVCREIPLSIEGATGRRVYSSESGENMSHTFLSRDADRAKKAAQMWDEGSSRHAQAIGELLGYPPCCVAAFVALGERGNNAALTYVTAARSRALSAPFAACLNSAIRHVLPCTPCSFGCPRAIHLAERVLDALPANVSKALRRALARPVLYFDEARAVVFEGAHIDGQTITFEEARFVSPSAPLPLEKELATRRLFGALFSGPGRLLVQDQAFEVHTAVGCKRLARIDARFGVVLPFSPEK